MEPVGWQRHATEEAIRDLAVLVHWAVADQISR